MKNLILLLFVIICFHAQAQDTLAIDADSVAIELQFDSIPEFTFFNPSEVDNYDNRIAAVQTHNHTQGIYFSLLLIFSVLLTWVYLNSRELVKSSLKSIVSLKQTIQFSRSDRQSNIFYFVLYALLFLSGLSLILYFIGNQIMDYDWPEWKLLILVFAVFVLDYLFSYFYIFFTSNSKTVDLVQAVVLNYAIILCLLIWPALFFIMLTGVAVAKIFAILLFALLGVILMIKEFRVLQVLWLEKIQIFSFHFFAYLCTFKFLPILVLIKIVLT